jgi:hypothetical protein
VTRLPAVLAAVLACAVATPAHAWAPIASSRPVWTGAAPYSLHQAGSADLGGYDATLPIVRDGMDDWTRVSCSALHTTFEGSTTNVPFRSGENTVGWIESSWIDDPNAIGITGPSFTSGRIVSAHMAMNGVNFTWTTGSGSGSSVNTYSITLHEAGHYYGLGHSSDGGATMYYAYSGGISRLGSDDEAGICALYPGGGGGTSPDGGTTDPPPDPPPSGTATFCDVCTSDASCVGSGSRCLRYPDGALYCGQLCSNDAECAGGSCEMISDGTRQCIRRDGAGAPDCSATAPPPDPEPDPDPGTDPPASGCTSDADCGPTEACDPSSGACVGRPGAMLGDACTTNDQCTSGLCAMDVEAGDSFCTQLCSATAPCPGEFECVGVEGGSSACRPMRGGLGDTCGVPMDCLSGLCAEGGAGRFCTRTCDGVTACSGGFDCIGTEGGGPSVCVESGPGGGFGGAPASSGLVGGCSAAAAGSKGAGCWALLLVLLPILLRRRGR